MRSSLVTKFGLQTSEADMEPLPEPFRILNDYWQGLAGGQVPERERIDIGRLKTILGYLMLVEFTEEPFRVRYRLTGTAVDRMTGLNITGRYLDEFAAGPFMAPIRYIESCYRLVRDSGRHFFGHYDWPVEDGLVKRTMMGLFPLSVGGRIRQCLSIENYGHFEAERTPIDWRPALGTGPLSVAPALISEWVGDQDRVVALGAGR
jgi:hypothetical protein